MADNLGADLDQLFAQACQRSRLRCLRYRQRPHEVAEIVGECMELKADRVGGGGAARQAGPTWPRLCPLLAGAAVVLEGNDALRRPRQVGDDEADARIKLASATPPWPPLVAACSMSRPGSRSWRSTGAPQAAVARPDASAGIRSCPARWGWSAVALGFEELVDLRVGEGGVAAEIAPLHRAPVASD